MRDWLRYFKVWFIVCGVIIAAILAVMVPGYMARKKEASEVVERVNKVCTETERVFDYGDVLTDEEEDSLRELIARREKQTQCDIVLVTMNESLEEYAKEYDTSAYGDDWVMIKADNFYDEKGFGWNKYVESDDGDGVLLLDNWFRESDGKIHTWFSTSGKAEDRYSVSMIDHLLDEVYKYIEDDPYKAYKAYIETFYKDMTSSGAYGSAGDVKIPWLAVLGLPLIVAVVYVCLNLSGKEGKKTTTTNTYLEGNKPDFKVHEDRFIRRTVTQHHIDRSSGSSGGSGGGGGHHTSSGGHSHGGGGHSR